MKMMVWSLFLVSAVLVPYRASANCADGLDNDGDGWIDKADPECKTSYDMETGVGVSSVFTCNDGIDNDVDGYTDAEDADDCLSAFDDEDGTCNDGLDNDGDGWTDSEDPDCTACNDDIWCWPSETGYSTTSCNDGNDNDFDGLVDAEDTVNCPTAWERESGDCADGRDNDRDGWIDYDDPDCMLDIDCSYECYPSETNMFFGMYGCNDGVDNDGDGLIDAADPSCVYSTYEEDAEAPGCGPKGRSYGLGGFFLLLPVALYRRQFGSSGKSSHPPDECRN